MSRIKLIKNEAQTPVTAAEVTAANAQDYVDQVFHLRSDSSYTASIIGTGKTFRGEDVLLLDNGKAVPVANFQKAYMSDADLQQRQDVDKHMHDCVDAIINKYRTAAQKLKMSPGPLTGGDGEWRHRTKFTIKYPDAGEISVMGAHGYGIDGTIKIGQSRTEIRATDLRVDRNTPEELAEWVYSKYPLDVAVAEYGA